MHLEYRDLAFKTPLIFEAVVFSEGCDECNNYMMPVKVESAVEIHVYLIYRCSDYMICSLTRGLVEESISC